MSGVEQQKQGIRTQVRDALRRVPAKVQNGGIQTTREFKKFYAEASKVIESPRANLPQLQSILNQVHGWY